jgi:archaemetzincin
MVTVMQIILQPVLFELDKDIRSSLEKALLKEFNAFPIVTAPPIKQIPEQQLLLLFDNQYSDKLNFVFGEAHLNGRICAIYLPRIRQEFYRLKPDKSLFYQRLVKEAVHELGHAFGLNHCENIKCVMHFSNSLSDTDIKISRLCNACRGHLI